MRRLKILTWHVHGAYLNALCRTEHDWYLPVKPDCPQRYAGRGWTFDLPAWVQEVPAEQVRNLDLDLIVYQSPANVHEDSREILFPRQQSLPAVYLEHNTPRPHAVDSRHLVADERMLLVHVTHFNRLMWDNGSAPTMVIEHSVAIDPTIECDGSLEAGIVVVNNMQGRPRITGFDLFQQARESVPLNTVGMGTEEFGGLGDLPYRDLHRAIASYRFLFSPMRYTSLPLAVIEAMTIGMPVVALATTELPSVIEDGVSGFLSCDPDVLIDRMRLLLRDASLARRLGGAARRAARARFGMERFTRDWNLAFTRAIELHRTSPPEPGLLASQLTNGAGSPMRATSGEGHAHRPD